MPDAAGPLTGIRVLEVGEQVSAPYAAKLLADLGADVVKIIATGGVMTPGVEPGAPQLTRDEIVATVQEARKAGRRTAAHAQGAEGIANAIEAGITSVEHGIYLSEETVLRMRERGTALVATLNAPAAISAGGAGAGIPDFMVRKAEAVIPSHVESFKLALRSGVTIVAGNDAGTPLKLARELAVAMVCNRGTGTPVGDIRLMRLTKVAIEAADRISFDEYLARYMAG